MAFSVQVENIKCGGCANTIRKRVMELEGVTGAEVVVEEGPPHGDLYELEQKTTYRVVDRHSGQTVMTFESLLEASLSTDTGLWDDYCFSGAREVCIAPDGLSAMVTYYDGREESHPLPQATQQEDGPTALDRFFAGYEESRRIFDALRAIDYQGDVRSEHMPEVVGENRTDIGTAWSIGYTKALLKHT